MSTIEPQAKPDTAKKIISAKDIGVYAAGVASGVGATIATDAVATSITEENPEPVDHASTDVVSEPQENITIEVKIAHVDSDMSFAEAFASARQQVGPGGVFEYNGRVYNTYYKEEWDSLTPDQQSEFQQSVDYDAVCVCEDSNADNEIEVLNVETVVDESGAEIVVTTVEANGEVIALVDVDGDAQLDVAAYDLNHDGRIDYVEADANGDGCVDVVLADRNGDSVVDIARVDTDSDGIVDVFAADENCDGSVDFVAEDFNRDGELAENEMFAIENNYDASNDFNNDVDVNSFMV